MTTHTPSVTRPGPQATGVPARLRYSSRSRPGRNALPWLAPAIIVVLALTLWPTIQGVAMSFTGKTLVGVGQGFIGFDNYAQLFQTSEFWSALGVTIIFTVSAVVVQLILGTALALLMTREMIGRGPIRTAILCTMIISPVVVGTVWRLLLNPGSGPITNLLRLVGIDGQQWLASPGTVVPTLIAIDSWQWTPLMMLIMMAGLQSISSDIYEAAQVDGAHAWQSLRHITLPLLVPSIGVAVLIRTIDAFRTFDMIYAATGGGPGTSSETLNIYAYLQGFQAYQIGYASAISVVMLVVVLIGVSLLQVIFGKHLWRSGL